jgi:membrane protease YdiL (CAAX protease family)
VAKSKAEPAKKPAEPAYGYRHWSRDPAVGLFAVLPLWLAYEALRGTLTPAERNGAEKIMLDALGLVGAYGLLVLRLCFGALVFTAALSLRKRQIPWLKVALVSALEGTVYGLLLGPLAAALATSVDRVLAIGTPASPLVQNLVGSLGAGIFEELVFRLGLMSLLVWAALRACRAFELPKALGFLAAILASALMFSAFHHLWGERFARPAFIFRTMAGVLLGLLMWLRGYGVAVYAHTMYDLHYYLVTGSP